MLNPFTDLLNYSFFVPTLLRITAAIYFFYIARHIIRNRVHAATLSFPLVGKLHIAFVWTAAAIISVVALALLAGLYTQWAAILGMAIALKYSLIPERLSTIRAFSRSTTVLLLVICLSLLITGAGALAFDRPL